MLLDEGAAIEEARLTAIHVARATAVPPTFDAKIALAMARIAVIIIIICTPSSAFASSLHGGRAFVAPRPPCAFPYGVSWRTRTRTARQSPGRPALYAYLPHHTPLRRTPLYRIRNRPLRPSSRPSFELGANARPAHCALFGALGGPPPLLSCRIILAAQQLLVSGPLSYYCASCALCFH